MEVTISLRLLIDILFYGVSIALSAMIIHRDWKIRRNYKRIADRWVNAGPVNRMHERLVRLFQEPIQKHNQFHPEDVEQMIAFVKSKDGINVQAFHFGNVPMTKWTEGTGMELAETMAKCIVSLEAQRAGLIDPLILMIEDQMKQLKAARAAQVAEATAP